MLALDPDRARTHALNYLRVGKARKDYYEWVCPEVLWYYAVWYYGKGFRETNKSSLAERGK